jgi:hypothetical protein
MIKLARVAVLVAIGTLTISGTVWAQAQSKDQQKCITKLNRDGLKTHETQAKINRKCVKDVGKGKVLPSAAEACLTSDPQGQVMKRQGKTNTAESSFCTGSGIPNYGYTSAATVNTAAVQAEIDLMHDMFGNPVDNNLFACDPNVNECLCQRNMINRIEEVMQVIGRVFQACKKSGLKATLGGITSPAGLQGCFDDPGTALSVVTDPGGQIADTVGFMTGTLNQECEATTSTANSFSGGVCNGLTGSAAQDCIVRRVRCRACLMINAFDGITSDCDTFDNGTADASCP